MSSASSASDSGIDLEKAKKLYGFSGNRGVNGTLEFPVKGAPPPLPEKDRIKSPRTKHLSHLPLAKINITPAPTKHRNRSHSFSSTPPATLMKLLRAQESTTKETQALLHAALSQLDAASARAAKAEAQIRARETSAILSHTQLTENAVRAHEAAARAHREAEAYKLQLRLRDDEVRRERDRAKAEERMRTEAEKEAERARSLAIKWRGEGRILKAKEDGRKEGFGEGLKRGRLVIAAAISAGDPYESRGLVGDGAAYIEEYDDESDNHRVQRQQRRRGKSRSRVSRSKRSESTRERVNSSSTRPRASEPATPFSEPPPPPPSEPSRVPPPSESESQTIIIRRARSIQTDPSLFQSERTRSRTTSSTASPLSRHSLNQQQQQILRAPSPPPQIFVQESPPPPLPPVISPPEQEEQSIKSEPFSPQIPQTPQQFPRPQVEISPIPIPPPISQVPFAPGIFPPSSFQQQPQFQYAPSEPVPQPPPVQPVYFPMPAPPAPAIRVVVTPAEEERDVQTPSTMTNENSSLKGLDFLHGFPAPPSRASSSGSAGPSRLGGGGFDPDLSTIHEHSREGTAFGGEEDFGDTRDTQGMTPDRSRNVEQWRMSLGGQPYSLGTLSPGAANDSDLLRPPSSNSNISNSRKRRAPPPSLDLGLERQLSSGSTSSRSIRIDIVPPSHPTSPTPLDPRNRSYGYTENPQDDAFLSPHHAPLTLSAEDGDVGDGPVIPTIKEEDEEDYDDDFDNSSYPSNRMPNPRDFSESSSSSMYPVPIVDSLPPGFVPTPNGTHIISLQRDGSGRGAVASTGFVNGGVTGGIPVGFYAHGNSSSHRDARRQDTQYPLYGAPGAIRGRGYDDNYSRSSSSGSSRSSSTTGSSSGTELGRPSKYARSKRSDARSDVSSRTRDRGLTSTFPPTMMSEGGYGYGTNSSGESARDTPRATMYATNMGQGNQGGHTLGGIYAMPGISGNPNAQHSKRSLPQYGTVPAAAVGVAFNGASSRMAASNVPMPEPSVPQYGVTPMPEPSVPQYQYDAAAARYSSPAGGTSNTTRMVPGVAYMPEPTVPAVTSYSSYPSTGFADGQQNTNLGSRRSLRRTKGSISGAAMMPEPSVPQYPASQNYPVEPSRITPAAVSMPEPGVPQYSNTSTSNPRGRGGGDVSRMTPAAMSMPEPTLTSIPTAPVTSVAEYPPSVYQTPRAAGSRMTAAAVSMPEPDIPRHGATAYGATGYQNQNQTPGGRNGGTSRVAPAAMSMPEPGVSTRIPGDINGGLSRMTPAAILMPEPGVQNRTPGGGSSTSRMAPAAMLMPEPGLPNHTPGGGSGTSRMTPAVVSMPEPSVLEHARTHQTPAGAASRMTAPAMSMPEPSVGSTITGTPAGGASRMTAPVLAMPEPSVGPTAVTGTSTPGGTSRMTAPLLPMPEPSSSSAYNSHVHQTPAGGNSRMTAPAISMPEPSVGSSSVEPFMPGSFTPGGVSSGSRVTPAAVSMPEPTLPQYGPSGGSQGHPTPGGGDTGSRTTPGVVSMPEPTVPQFGSATPRNAGNVSMPEPSVPQFGVNGSSPAAASVSRITVPAVSMPEPTIPQVVPQANSTTTPVEGSSRMTAPAMSMPEPSVPNAKTLTKAQKKKQKKKGGISMPEPEVPEYDTAGAGGSSGISMPEPSVPSFDIHESELTPSGGTSRMIPPTIPMPEPSSNITAPAITMPIPSIGTPSLSMGGNNLPQQPSSPSASAWGLGTPGGWGYGASINGPGTPNTNRRASLHAGTTPITMSQPLPVPNPVPGPAAALRKGRKPTGSSASSVDSTTMRNTEANKGVPRSARARGMTSAWGA